MQIHRHSEWNRSRLTVASPDAVTSTCPLGPCGEPEEEGGGETVADFGLGGQEEGMRG